jgi:hypothetical protein
MISPQEWQGFADALYEFNSEVGTQPVIWRTPSIDLDRYGEDTKPSYESRTLLALVAYNAFRVWPIGKETSPGVVDGQYCYLLLNNQYLAENSWLTVNKNFIAKPNEDLFTINGLEYQSMGDTPVSQNNNNPLYSIIVLERKTTPTGTNPRP